MKSKSASAKKQKSLTAPMPHWDLSDLYASIKSPDIKKDLAWLDKSCKEFQRLYEGKITSLSGEQMARAVKNYEAIEERMGRLGSYAQLVFSENMNDPNNGQFYQNIQEQLTDIGTKILFFTLDINKISEKAYQAMLKQSADLRKYEPWLREIRILKPYQLSDELEKMLHEKSVTGHAAWSRLFDETLAGLRFKYKGKELSSEEILSNLSSPKEAIRKESAEIFGKELGKHAKTFALITNTLAKDKEIEDKWRGFKRPIESRNVSNSVENEVVDALLTAVKKSYPKLSHRYYAQKAKWFGAKKLDYWNRNAPLPGAVNTKYSWQEAKDLVLSSYIAFSPALGKIARQFFDNAWIDVPPRPGKAPGAFAHPTVPSAHPYLLLNFQERTRDVMTLAHELGHGVHQVLSNKQGALMSDTPLTLAETASVFGEQLTFQELLKREKNAKARKHLIAGKVEDMLNTVVRQTAFCEFERLLHDERRKGELTVEQIGKLWMQVQIESLGPALRFAPDYQYYWSYIPHFIHTPFYVYAYAFGDCLVNSLYAVYQKENAKGKGREFEKKYLAMLEAGGTLRHKELLKPFGLDASKPQFWQQGLNIISAYIDELED